MNEASLQFSVIMPSYNRGHCLCKAIDSVLAQQQRAIEIIIVDDGSTDNTKTLLQQRYCQDSRIKYVYQRHRGAAAARNTGIRLSSGQYIAFLNSDDEWLADKLSNDIALFNRFPQVDVVISNAEMWRFGKQVVSNWFELAGVVCEKDQPRLFSWENECWLNDNFFASSALVIKRSAFNKLDAEPFDTALSVYEDWAFQLQLYNRCAVIFNPQLMARVRRAVDDVSRNEEVLQDSLQLERLICREMAKDNVLARAAKHAYWSFDNRKKILNKRKAIKQQIATHFSKYAI